MECSLCGNKDPDRANLSIACKECGAKEFFHPSWSSASGVMGYMYEGDFTFIEDNYSNHNEVAQKEKLIKEQKDMQRENELKEFSSFTVRVAIYALILFTLLGIIAVAFVMITGIL